MAALVAFDKMPLLVHEALVSEVTARHKIARYVLVYRQACLHCGMRQ